MADTLTPNYSYVKPEIGGSDDTWGNKTNVNWDKVDTMFLERPTKVIWDATAEKVTVVDDDIFHGQNSAASGAFSKWKWVTLKNAVLAQVAALGLGYVTGDFKFSAVKIAPAGWLIANGNSIGNAASGATARANADTAALFTLLWTNYAQAQLTMQNSSGTTTARGATAAADYAANRRMPLPDLRGRGFAGWDDLANVVRLTDPLDDTFGAVGGTHTKILVLSEIPAHAHGAGTLVTDTAPDHIHSVPMSLVGTNGGGSSRYESFGTTNTGAAGAHSHAVTGSTASAGSTQPHDNVQPTFIGNILIKM